MESSAARARARAPSRARSPLSRRYHKPRFNFFLEFGGADGLARALSEQIQKRRAEAKEEERIRAEFASSPEGRRARATSRATSPASRSAPGSPTAAASPTASPAAKAGFFSSPVKPEL